MTMKPSEIEDLRDEAWSRLTGGASAIFSRDAADHPDGERNLEYVKVQALLSISAELGLIRAMLERKQGGS
ncbi:hypothetical protein [Mycobacteroides abscessus]|uniref:hypothetical protein n=1 Tax=Mycobacteroides abscessus TaxID=36809 RepID=UPI0005DF658F|nr:hypothetical protein [Mycobacteroides abscessus]CPW40756.1 Uncharacterised protein [Mycobacteroides abscessus]SKF60107.1 Uncharacterised protein [Mycobacteroides abscessus subsp. bolletii]SKH50957.1 Uncharacterised protein [Mycobacteroides abscessus subsp. bolletii]